VLGVSFALGAAGCGGGARDGAAPGAGPRPKPVTPSLAAGPRRPGEIVISGQGTPVARGPYRLHGRYRIRMQQLDPEQPGRTFADQTTFVAVAAPAPDQDSGPGVTRLIRKAARTASATVELDGTMYVNVTFGDFPFTLRMTPVP
jgi:hypothetical protein